MDDTTEVIRQQMEETKSQISDKLVSLENQVSDTVQSTGSAVNATVEAVQETVETVTEAVQDAVQSVSNAFDLQRQIERNPWLILGGAAVLGYLAFEFITGAAKKSPQPSEFVPQSPTSGNNTSDRDARQAAESAAATAAALAAAYESGRNSSSWHQLNGVAIGALIDVVQNIATLAVPPLVEHLTGQHPGDRLRSNGTVDRRGSSRRNESPEAAQRLHIVPTER
jgi:uncharacterized protein YoxC